MAKARGGLISNFRTVSATEASGIFKPNFITALNRDGGFPAPHSFKINSNGSINTFFPGNTGYVRHGGEWAHSITVGATNVTVTFYLWGAAGGVGKYNAGYHSGNGALCYATTTLQVGTTYYLYIGEAGGGTNAGNGDGGDAGWPNGGFGVKGDASGAGGGGMTMLSKATFATGMSDSDILMIAAGGGGTCGYAGHGGSGGGATGDSASATTASSGVGGSQSAGGASNGAKLQGGSPTGGSQTVSNSNDSSGGGGGYYGGGAGSGDGKPAGGGSSYYNTSLTTSQTYTKVSSNPGNNNTQSSLNNAPDVNTLLANSNWAGNSHVKYAQGQLSTQGTTVVPAGNGLVYFSIS